MVQTINQVQNVEFPACHVDSQGGIRHKNKPEAVRFHHQQEKFEENMWCFPSLICFLLIWLYSCVVTPIKYHGIMTNPAGSVLASSSNDICVQENKLELPPTVAEKTLTWVKTHGDSRLTSRFCNMRLALICSDPYLPVFALNMLSPHIQESLVYIVLALLFEGQSCQNWWSWKYIKSTGTLNLPFTGRIILVRT